MKTFGLVLCSAVVGAAFVFGIDTWIKRPSPTPAPTIDLSHINSSIDHIVDVQGTLLSALIEIDRGQSELGVKVGELTASEKSSQRGCQCRHGRRCRESCEH